MESINQTALQQIGYYLRQRKQSVSVAESVTSGLLQVQFSHIPDAEKFFQGGITAYNIGQKARHLSVEPLHAIETNCVSQQVADEMSLAVAQFFSSDWGIAITGYATPSKESGNALFSYFTISRKQKIALQQRITSGAVNPPDVQQDYCNQVLSAFLRLLVVEG